MSADYLPLKVPLTVDVTTGDKITPREVEYSFQLMFDERSITVLAYNLETIMDEIKSSSRLIDFWRRYQRDFAYADDISYEDICQAMEEILNKTL